MSRIPPWCAAWTTTPVLSLRSRPPAPASAPSVAGGAYAGPGGPLIGGGGRYDGLVELEGGKPTAGVGFAVGFERALLALQAFGSDLGADEAPCVYVANAGKELRQNVFAITQELRAAGIVTEADYQGRSLKAQFKQADKVGAKLILVLGGDELAAGKVKVRDMESHEEVLADLANVVEAVRERL